MVRLIWFLFFQFYIKIYTEGLPDGSAKHLGVLLTTSQTLLINRQHLKWHTMNSVIYCDIKFQAFSSHWYLDQITNKQAIYIYTHCTVYILVLIHVSGRNSPTCNPTTNSLTYILMDLHCYTQARSVSQLVLHTCLRRDSSPRARTSPLVSIWPNLRIYKGRPSRNKE